MGNNITRKIETDDQGHRIVILEKSSPHTQPNTTDSEILITPNANDWDLKKIELDSNGEMVSQKNAYTSDNLLLPTWLNVLEPLKHSLFSAQLDFDRGEESLRLVLNPTGDEDILPIVESAAEEFLSHAALSYETELKTQFEQLKKNAGPRDISFAGKTFQIGKDDVNESVNSILEQVGSTKRVFFAVNSNHQTAALMGELDHEEKKSATFYGLKSSVRLVALKNVDFYINLSEQELAVNDQISTVVIVKDHLQKIWDQKAQLPVALNGFKDDESQQLQTATRTLSDADLALFGNLVLTHEFGHLKSREQRGMEVRYVQMNAPSDFHTLHVVEEGLADLNVLEQSLELSRTHPELAQKQILLWAAFRHVNTGAPELAYAPLINKICLSALTFSNGQWQVDWAQLKKKSTSFRERLVSIAAEVKHNFVMDFNVTLLNKNDQKVRATPPDKLIAQYEYAMAEATKLKVSQEEAKGNEVPSAIMAHLNLVSGAVESTLSADQGARKDVFGMDQIKYAFWIDQWAQQELGLNEPKLPFNAPHVLEVKPE